MKNAAIFYLESMQQNKDGYFVTSPSVSFENTFKKPDGTVGWACEGPTQDIQIIRDLFENCISASQILNTDSDFAVKLKRKIRPIASNAKLTLKQKDFKNGMMIGKPHIPIMVK